MSQRCQTRTHAPQRNVSSITSSARASSTGPAPGFSVFRVDTDQLSAAHWARNLLRRNVRRIPLIWIVRAVGPA